jgi:hypothetical protein
MFVTDYSLGTQKLAVGEPTSEKETHSAAAHQVRAIAGICNAAEFDSSTASLPLVDRHVFGDATDQAALMFSESIGPVAALRGACKSIFELAFNSKNKFMAKAITFVDNQTRDVCLSPAEIATFEPGSVYVSP